MKSHAPRILLGFAALLSFTPLAFAGPGSLDPGFSRTGYTTLSMDSARHMAVMGDGRILVAGTIEREYEESYHDDLRITRHYSSGTLDQTFPTINVNIASGYDEDDYPERTNDYASDIVVQPDGKFLVSGFSRYSDGTRLTFLLRYNSDGSPDHAFGENGRIISDTGLPTASVIVLPDGKILLGGSMPQTGSGGVTVTRLNADGSADPTFPGSGKSLSAGSLHYNYFTEMSVQPDGKIVIVGASYNDEWDEYPSTRDTFIMRLTAQGALDTTFDGDGVIETVSAKQDFPTTLKIQPDGKILVAGTIVHDANATTDTSQIDATVTRYTSTGALDPSFSGDGVVSYAIGVSDVTDMVLQEDGKIVLVGNVRIQAADTNIGMVRFTPSGVLDPGFGFGGIALTDFGWEGSNKHDMSSYDRVSEATLLPDGKILVIGEGLKEYILARFSMLIQTDAMVGTKASGMSGNNIYNGSGAGQTVSLSVKRASGKKTSSKTAYVRIQNDGTTTQPFIVQGVASDKFLTVKYINGKTDVTKQVTAGTFRTGSLVPGASHLLKVVITAKTPAKNKSRNFYVTGRASTDLGSWDSVLIKATSK